MPDCRSQAPEAPIPQRLNCESLSEGGPCRSPFSRSRARGTGGASDGNFTATLGIPTLDGLGPVGDGAHALDEHVVIEELPLRAALLAGLLSGMHDYKPWSLSDVGAGLQTGPRRPA
jgi:hypothetical protein